MTRKPSHAWQTSGRMLSVERGPIASRIQLVLNGPYYHHTELRELIENSQLRSDSKVSWKQVNPLYTCWVAPGTIRFITALRAWKTDALPDVLIFVVPRQRAIPDQTCQYGNCRAIQICSDNHDDQNKTRNSHEEQFLTKCGDSI